MGDLNNLRSMFDRANVRYHDRPHKSQYYTSNMETPHRLLGPCSDVHCHEIVVFGSGAWSEYIFDKDGMLVSHHVQD